MQIALDQCDSRTFHRHIGPRTHGDPDMSLRQRWRVVDAVTSHGDEPAFVLKFLHHSGLLIGQHLCHDIVDAEPAGDGLCRGAAVPGQHHHPNAFLAKHP